MIKFYDVDQNYTKLLQTIDNQIPNIGYEKNNKFLCGIVLSINDINYYAPISHNTKVHRTSLPIYNKRNEVIASIRFSFMFPAPLSALKEKNFKESSAVDPLYTDLLSAEYRYCLANEDEIYKKAQSVYSIGCNKNHVLNYTCCDFKKLELAYLKLIEGEKEAAGTTPQDT